MERKRADILRQAHLWHARQLCTLVAEEDISKQDGGHLQGMLADGGDFTKALTAASRQGSVESPLKVAVELAAAQPAKLEAAAVPEVMQANVCRLPCRRLEQKLILSCKSRKSSSR